MSRISKIIVFIFCFFQLGFGQNNNYLILISWDGCRWDYLNRGLTPTVQKLIDGGVRAKSLQPSFPTKTFPNHYSIVTGLYPINHGIVFNGFTDFRSGESYRLKKDDSVRLDKWYKGESIWHYARQFDIKSGVLFWPGSETYNKHPDYFVPYQHNKPHAERIDQLIQWLSLPEPARPRFLSLYFADTDDAGHKYGPDSEQLQSVLKELDSTLATLLVHLKKMKIFNRTNIVLVSDHGMTNIYEEKSIDIQKMIAGFNVKTNGHDPNLTLFVGKEEVEAIYAILKKNNSGFSVYKKDDIPSDFYIKKSPLIGDIFIMAKPGYHLKNSYSPSKGNHGFDNKVKDMHGIFVAYGPAFKAGLQTRTLLNIDIFPLLVDALGLPQNKNIDGSLGRVQHLLK